MAGDHTNIIAYTGSITLESIKGPEKSLAANGNVITIDPENGGGGLTIPLRIKPTELERENGLNLTVWVGERIGFKTQVSSASISFTEEGLTEVYIPLNDLIGSIHTGNTQTVWIELERSSGAGKKESKKTRTAYAFKVKLDSTKSAGHKVKTATYDDFAKGVFDKMARTGSTVVDSFLMVVAHHDGDPAQKDKLFFSGPNGAVTVFSQAGWRKVRENYFPDGPAEVVFERTIPPEELTGAMKQEFERLPLTLQGKIRKEGGITIRQTIVYAPSTPKGYEFMLQEMHKYQIVQLVGHRLGAFPGMVDNFSSSNPIGSPVAMMFHHCTSLDAANIPLLKKFPGKIYAPVGTTDKTYGGGPSSERFVVAMVTGQGDPKSILAVMKETYGKMTAIKSVPQLTPPLVNFNADLDGDGIADSSDPCHDDPNWHSTDGEVTVVCRDGTFKIPYYNPEQSPAEMQKAFAANEVTPEELQSLGTAGQLEPVSDPSRQYCPAYPGEQLY